MAKIEAKKRATAIPAGLEITPSDGYDAMLEVILAAEPNFKPENIMAGIEVWGKIGTATPTESNNNSGFYPNDDKDDPDEPYDPDKPGNTKVPNKIIEKETGQSADTFDVMILQNGTGDVTYGFLEKGLCNYGGVVTSTPVYDTVKYPYAYFMTLAGGHNFYVCENPMTYEPDPDYPASLMIKLTGSWQRFHFYNTETSIDEWNLEESGNGDEFLTNYRDTVKWANHDILDEDGEVFLEGSDPIPVGSGVPFEITWYDPYTTNFKAKGWRRLSYHRQGDYWQSDDFTTVESGGWNYLKHITECTREKLYYMGIEVWPNMSQTWSYNGVELPALPAWDRAKYPHAWIYQSKTTGNYVLRVTSVPVTYTYDRLLNKGYVYSLNGTGNTYPLEQDTWTLFQEDVEFGNYFAISDFLSLWSNHAIKGEEGGGVYQSASIPTPV